MMITKLHPWPTFPCDTCFCYCFPALAWMCQEKGGGYQNRVLKYTVQNSEQDHRNQVCTKYQVSVTGYQVSWQGLHQHWVLMYSTISWVVSLSLESWRHQNIVAFDIQAGLVLQKWRCVWYPSLIQMWDGMGGGGNSVKPIFHFTAKTLSQFTV